MIEGFAEGGPSSFYAPSDWRLQMTRALGLVLVAVNPDERAHVLALSGPAKRVQPAGGGALDSRADTRAWALRLVPVRGRVVIPAHGGMVLLDG